MILYYLTLLLIPFYNHPLMSYNVSGMTPIKALGGGALLWATVAGTTNRATTAERSISLRYFILFVVCICISLMENAASLNQTALLRFVSILVFAFTTLSLVNTRQKLLWSCVVLLLAMDIAAAYVVKDFLRYRSVYQDFRAAGIFGDPNYYAASAVAVFPLAYYLRKDTANKWLSYFCLGSMAATIVGVLISQSRGGWIGLGVVILAILYRTRHRTRLIFMLAISGIAILALSPIDLTKRFSGNDTGTSTSTESRLNLLYCGLEMAGHNPLMGVGLGNFKRFSADYYTLKAPQIAHNSYLEIAAENGIPALVVFLLMCLAVKKDIGTAIRLHSHDPSIRNALMGISVGILGFLTAAAFLSAEYEKMLWVLCFLTMASLRIEPIDPMVDEHYSQFDEAAAPAASEVI